VRYKILLSFIFLLIGFLLSHEVKAQSEKNLSLSSRNENVPINITSDQLEVHANDNVIIFTGSVMARQGDISIYSDHMSVYYRETENEGFSRKNQSQVDKIVAEGHVKIVKEGWIAIAQRAIFFSKDQKVELTGNPRVWQGKNLVKGDRITLDFRENKSTVERGKDKRVEATIYPEARK